MDLEAAKRANSYSTRLTMVGMIACFVTAGAMLIASLAVAKAPDAKTFPTAQTLPR